MIYEVYVRSPEGRTGLPFSIKTHGNFGRALFHLNACYRRYGCDGTGDIYGIRARPDTAAARLVLERPRPFVAVCERP